MADPSLYVHIPFCETKCPYCDFNSFAIEGRDVDGHLDALRREMDARGVPRNPATVFIGGGTPTAVEKILENIRTEKVWNGTAQARRDRTVAAADGITLFTQYRAYDIKMTDGRITSVDASDKSNDVRGINIINYCLYNRPFLI